MGISSPSHQGIPSRRRPLKTSVDACGESPRNDATVGHHAGTIDAFGEPVGGILSIVL